MPGTEVTLIWDAGKADKTLAAFNIVLTKGQKMVNFRMGIHPDYREESGMWYRCALPDLREGIDRDFDELISGPTSYKSKMELGYEDDPMVIGMRGLPVIGGYWTGLNRIYFNRIRDPRFLEVR